MATIEFSRGDGNYHTFSIETTSWSAGGKLFFAAKPAVDDDTTDGNALINWEWDDTFLLPDVIINGVPCKQYNCYFPPAATNNVLSNGADSLDLLGEFQYVPTTGVPITFPATIPKLDAVIYFDIKRKITV